MLMLIQPKSSIVDAVSTNQTFIGIHDLFEEGEWLTIEGKTLDQAGYDEWHFKLNNPTGSPQNCGTLTDNVDLNDVCCDHKYAFFCEK